MGSKQKTKTRIDKDLARESRYSMGRARDLLEREDTLPSQYVGISDPRQQGLDQIMSLAGQRGGSMVPRDTLNEYGKTIRGDYLDANPFIDEIVRRSSSMAGAAPVASFAGGGRFGSGAMSQAIADATAATASNLYGANYENERGRMMSALGQAGAMEQLQYADAGRMQDVGRAQEADQLAVAQEQLRQYMNPYMQQQMFEGSLASNPLNRQGTTTQSGGFDWGSALFGLAGSATG